MQSFVLLMGIMLLNLSILNSEGGRVPEIFPKTVRITPRVRNYFAESALGQVTGLEEHVVRRSARSMRSCRYPTSTEDSDIFCKIYPARIECNQTCMFGYTFKEGKTRTMKCNKEEDEWTPFRRFEQCRPYIDCTVSLGPGGKMSCKTHFMDRGAVCDISCQHYEDKESVPKKTYTCDGDGKWHPKLPFCSSSGSGLDLVLPPS